MVLKDGPEKRLKLVREWANRWGNIVPGLFRLIPGVRFPGHLMCGALGIKNTTFLLVDGLVVMTVVPTQIYFISIYGEEVIQILKRFQLILGVAGAIVLLIILRNSYKMIRRKPVKSVS